MKQPMTFHIAYTISNLKKKFAQFFNLLRLDAMHLREGY
jgi:hypothetical protein